MGTWRQGTSPNSILLLHLWGSGFLMLFTFLRTPLLAPPSRLLGRRPPVNRWRRGEKRPLKQLQLSLFVFSIQIHALDMVLKSINPFGKTEPSGIIGQSFKWCRKKGKMWLLLIGRGLHWLNWKQLKGFFCLVFFPLKFFFKSVLSNCPQRWQEAQLKLLLSFAVTASPSTLASQGMMLWPIGFLAIYPSLTDEWSAQIWIIKLTSFCVSQTLSILWFNVDSTYSLNANTYSTLTRFQALLKAVRMLRQMRHRS